MKKIFIFVMFLTLCAISALAQEKTPEEELKNYKPQLIAEGINGPIRFDFVRKDTREVTASFDLIANSPFHNLEFPVTYNHEAGFMGYDLKNVDKEEIFDRFLSHIPEAEKSKYDFEAANVGYSFYVGKYGQEVLNYVAAVYPMIFYDSKEEPVMATTTAIILNSKGEEAARLENIDADCLTPLVTNDGKYFAFKYGGELNDNFDRVMYPGIRIYDVNTGELIMDRRLDEGYGWIAGPSLRGDLIGVKFQSEKSVKYLFYDLNKRIVYSKAYPREMYIRGKLKEITGGPYILNAGEKDTFEEDFDKENF